MKTLEFRRLVREEIERLHEGYMWCPKCQAGVWTNQADCEDCGAKLQPQGRPVKETGLNPNEPGPKKFGVPNAELMDWLERGTNRDAKRMAQGVTMRYPQLTDAKVAQIVKDWLTSRKDPRAGMKESKKVVKEWTVSDVELAMKRAGLTHDATMKLPRLKQLSAANNGNLTLSDLVKVGLATTKSGYSTQTQRELEKMHGPKEVKSVREAWDDDDASCPQCGGPLPHYFPTTKAAIEACPKCKGKKTSVKKEAAPHQAYIRTPGYDPRGPGGKRGMPTKIKKEARDHTYQIGEHPVDSLWDAEKWVLAEIDDFLRENDMELLRDKNGKALYETSVVVKFRKH